MQPMRSQDKIYVGTEETPSMERGEFEREFCASAQHAAAAVQGNCRVGQLLYV